MIKSFVFVACVVLSARSLSCLVCCISWFCCALLSVYSSQERPPRNRLYIMTLGVLAAYRNHGIGKKLVQSVLDYFTEQKDEKFSQVDEIMLHVQSNNDDAIKFYEKMGFEKGELVEGYYKRIDPPDCYVLKKKLR